MGQNGTKWNEKLKKPVLVPFVGNPRLLGSVPIQVVLLWNQGRHLGLPLLFPRSYHLNRTAMRLPHIVGSPYRQRVQFAGPQSAPH